MWNGNTHLAPDSRGRMLCGHTLQDGEKVVIVCDGGQERDY